MSSASDRAEHDASRFAAALVRWSIAHAWAVIAVSLVLTLGAGWYAATHFAITTETDQLLTSDSQWHADKRAYAQAFPQLDKVILVVVDALTPEQADEAAASLSARLEKEPGPAIRQVWRPDGGPFFDQEGLLLLPLDQVAKTTGQLSEEAPTLLALSGDPSLRGLLRLIQLGASGDELSDKASLLGGLSDTLGKVLKGEPARLSWGDMLGGGGSGQPKRRFVLVSPNLDFKALQPALNATTRIRAAAAELGLTDQKGVRVRLTGEAPLADEEFATVEDGAPFHLGLSILGIAVILFVALRSGRIILAVLLTTMAGLVMTVGLGLLMVGRFNVISVAVAALFLGLGVDFAIQVAVRYRDERHKDDRIQPALVSMGRGIGWSLTLAAVSLLAGFFSFLPTSFKGVSELGLITGVGMILAFLLSLTLLPALIGITNPPGEADTVETPGLASIDEWILRHRLLVAGASILLVLLGIPLLLRLDFDANPMHLRSAKTEAVATFLDLTRQAGMTPYTLTVLAPSLDAARPLSARLAALPEVDRVVSLNSFIPGDQPRKLAAIRAAAKDLDGLVNPQPPAPAPTDAELVDALTKTASILDGKAGAPPQFRTLAANFTRLATATPALRAAAAAAVSGDLPGLLRRIGTLLTAKPITLETLPKTLVDDWLSVDGRARIDVAPKGNADDNAVLQRFTDAVRAVAPNVAGGPVDVVESHGIIVDAFTTAALVALVAVFAILSVALRNPKDVALTLGPLVIATILTLEAMQLIGMNLNLANIIALPLMLAVGVNFHIYYMIAWRAGVRDLLASSLTRAIFFSSLTTGIAFGSLVLSKHPGTASMGQLLSLSLFFTLLAAFIIVPAFLGPPREG